MGSCGGDAAALPPYLHTEVCRKCRSTLTPYGPVARNEQREPKCTERGRRGWFEHWVEIGKSEPFSDPGVLTVIRTDEPQGGLWQS